MARVPFPERLPARSIDLPSVAGRPLAVRPVIGAWLAIATAIVVGVNWYDRNFNPEFGPFGINPGSSIGASVRTYQYAAELALAGEPFYGVAPSGLGDWAVYLYPPITTIAFAPLTLMEWWTGYELVVALNALAGIFTAALVVRFIERRGYQLGWLDALLIVALFLLSPFTAGTMYYGNINLIFALVFTAGFLALEHDRETVPGVLFGLAALVKLFPTIVGVWFLRLRAWRAVAAAVAVGAGGILAGIPVFGWARTREFFTVVVLDRSETASFVGGYPARSTYYITIQRPISQLLWTIWPDAPAALLPILTVLLLGGLLVVFYREIADPFERLLAIFVTIVVTIVVVPSLQWYLVLLFFPLVPLLYLWEGPGRLPFIAGSMLLFFNDSPGSLHGWLDDANLPRLLELLLRDVFTLATIQLYAIGLMIAAAWWYRYQRRHEVNVVARCRAILGRS